MKIGLDLRMLGGGSGIDRYISELSHEILKQDKTNQYVLFFRYADLPAGKAGKSAGYEQYGHKIVIADIPHYSFAEQWKLPGILKKENLDLVHFPHFNVPIFCHLPFVVTIHDLTHSRFPGRKKSHFFHRLAYNWVLRNAIKKSKRIIAVSQSTKMEIVEFFGIDPSKIQVVYEGANNSYKMMDKESAFARIFSRFGITKPFILFVGVWRRYKNLPNLAKAFDKIVEKGFDGQLVLAGATDPNYPEILQQVLVIKNQDRMILPGRVSEQDLIYLYNAATLFVLPSLAEGFGLTALEAASCGLVIACSDIPTFREVLGQAAVYFDPGNVENMAEVILAVLDNAQRREELANQALNRTKHFSWKKTAEQTIGVYQKAGLSLREPRQQYSLKILLAGGGSGGPVSPVLAVAEELKKLEPSVKFLFVGTKNGPEKEMVESAGISFASISAAKLRRYFSFRNLIDVFVFIFSLFQAYRIVRSFRPHVIFSAGGFVAVPICWIGKIFGSRMVIHQQDAKIGLANKLVGFLAARITTAFEHSSKQFYSGSGLFKNEKSLLVEWVGNPVRREIIKPDLSKLDFFNLHNQLPILLVLTGATGANQINDLIKKTITELVKSHQVVHQTGKGKNTIHFLDPNYHAYEMIPFPQYAAILSSAHLVISRAGLSSLAELSAAGKVAIVIPKPYTHQEENGKMLEASSAAVVLSKARANPETLLKAVNNLKYNPNRQELLAFNMKKLMPANAALKIAKIILQTHGQT